MKTQLNDPIKIVTSIFLMLTAMLFLGFGCNTLKPIADPLAGFHMDFDYTPDTNMAITDDYKNYIRTLTPEEQEQAGLIFFYEDQTGEHAVKIKIGINGTSWEHVLVYDKDNKRIKTIKYSTGRYAS